MPTLTQERLLRHRAATFRLPPHSPVTNVDEAVAFVEERGFVFFWPIGGLTLPSLWVAVAGDRPVADEHDDPGHVTWGWKDDLLGARRWYYARVLHRRSTMIALRLAPYFYALSENFGSPEEDYRSQYAEGRLSQEAKQVYETLLDQGPLDTITLRQQARLTSRESSASFNRALNELMADFKLLPVGVARAGSWNYAHIYDLTHRYYPALAEQARVISQDAARARLVDSLLRSLGAVRVKDVTRLFGWRAPEAERALVDLQASGAVCRHVALEGDSGDWNVLADLLEASSPA